MIVRQHISGVLVSLVIFWLQICCRVSVQKKWKSGTEISEVTGKNKTDFSLTNSDENSAFKALQCITRNHANNSLSSRLRRNTSYRPTMPVLRKPASALITQFLCEVCNTHSYFDNGHVPYAALCAKKLHVTVMVLVTLAIEKKSSWCSMAGYMTRKTHTVITAKRFDTLATKPL